MSSLGEAERAAEQAVLQVALDRGYLRAEQVDAARAWQKGEHARGQPGRVLQHLAERTLTPAQVEALRTVHREALTRPDPFATVVPDAAPKPPPPDRVETQDATPEASASGPAPRSLLPAADDRIGDYTVVEELARGGMGAVYVARDGLGRRVALKVMLDDSNERSQARFELEARASARLRHPGIVTIHAYGIDDGRAHLAMEFVEGESLQELVEREGPLAPERAAAFGRELARIMAYAHSQGVLHRDLKPQNVLLAKDGRLVVTDFGLARVVDQSQHLTRTGNVLGTPAYLPPEQAKGDVANMGPHSDVYSLGATLYALLTGQAPFGDMQLIALVIAASKLDPDPPSSLQPRVPKALDAIVLTCMEKAPARRYSSADALAADLDAFLQGGRVQARRVRTRRRLGRVGLSLLGVAGLVSIGAWALHAPESGREPQGATSAPLGSEAPATPSVLTVSSDRELTLSERGEASVLCDVKGPEEHSAVTVLLVAPAEAAWRIEIDALRPDDTWDLAGHDSPADALLLLSPKGYPALGAGRLRVRVHGPPGGQATLEVRFLGETEVPPPLHVGLPVPPIEECFAPASRDEARELTAAFRKWVDGSLEANWVDPNSDLRLEDYPQVSSAFSSIKAHAARDSNPRARLFAACLATLLPSSPRRKFKAPAAIGADWLKRAPSDPYAHWLVGRNTQSQGKHASAERHLQVAVSLLPREALPRAALAGCLVKRGDLQAAEALLRPLLNRNPKHPYANVLLGQIRFARGEHAWELALGQMVFGCEQYASDTRRLEGLSRVADRLDEIRTRAPALVPRTAARVVELLAPQVPLRERGDLSAGSWIDLRVVYGRCLALAGRLSDSVQSLRDVEAEIVERKWKVPRRLRKIRQGIATIEARKGQDPPPGR